MELISWIMARSESNKMRTVLPSWTTLLEQHRMNPEIRKLVSELIYDGKLVDSFTVNSKSTLVFNEYLEITQNGHRIAVIDHDVCETGVNIYIKNSTTRVNHFFSLSLKVNHSFKNDGEVILIVDLIRKLLENGVDTNEITVLTFYDAQRVELLLATEMEFGKNKVGIFLNILINIEL
jgi:superfamily I DNA and/or RNA helicase